MLRDKLLSVKDGASLVILTVKVTKDVPLLAFSTRKYHIFSNQLFYKKSNVKYHKVSYFQ